MYYQTIEATVQEYSVMIQESHSLIGSKHKLKKYQGQEITIHLHNLEFMETTIIIKKKVERNRRNE